MIWTLLPFAIVAIFLALILLASRLQADKPICVSKDQVLSHWSPGNEKAAFGAPGSLSRPALSSQENRFCINQNYQITSRTFVGSERLKKIS